MSSLIKNTLILGGLLVLAGLGYYLFVINSSSVIQVNNEQVSLQAEAETQDFLRRLNELKTIELSSSLFTGTDFLRLVDYTTPIQPQTIGRDDPFKPVF